jgi:hypothetical protein
LRVAVTKLARSSADSRLRRGVAVEKPAVPLPMRGGWEAESPVKA